MTSHLALKVIFVNNSVLLLSDIASWIQAHCSVRQCAYMPTYIHTYICTYIYIYIRMYVHIHIHTYVHTYTHTTHTHMHTYTHTHTHKAATFSYTCAHMIRYCLFPVTIALNVYAITVLKCFNMLKNIEFEHLFVMSHKYVCLLVPCLLLNLCSMNGWFSMNLEASENNYDAILK